MHPSLPFRKDSQVCYCLTRGSVVSKAFSSTLWSSEFLASDSAKRSWGDDEVFGGSMVSHEP